MHCNCSRIAISSCGLTCRCVVLCTCCSHPSSRASSRPSSRPCCPCPCPRHHSSCWVLRCGSRQHGLLSAPHELRQGCQAPAVMQDRGDHITLVVSARLKTSMKTRKVNMKDSGQIRVHWWPQACSRPLRHMRHMACMEPVR
jgi:hypothetical protein